MKETCYLLTSSYSVRSWNQYTTAIDVNNAERGEWSSIALFLGWRRIQEMVAFRACRACRRTCIATPPGNTPSSPECRAAAPRARVGTGCLRLASAAAACSAVTRVKLARATQTTSQELKHCDSFPLRQRSDLLKLLETVWIRPPETNEIATGK
ncbi:hypothetical protein B296_00057059 [Ensete ventricosum]|uniref:Uncharacterized protein n=1 Tax=Ensete ventricosum TaxID=4639 RepID=A0A426X3F6_ENSVE|nr:hypothetical protein B296_00057059 [Ensete ventricosum]